MQGSCGDRCDYSSNCLTAPSEAGSCFGLPWILPALDQHLPRTLNLKQSRNTTHPSTWSTHSKASRKVLSTLLNQHLLIHILIPFHTLHLLSHLVQIRPSSPQLTLRITFNRVNRKWIGIRRILLSSTTRSMTLPMYPHLCVFLKELVNQGPQRERELEE